MARSRYSFGPKDAPHFLTDTVLDWLPVFTRQERVDIIFDSWRYLRQHHGLRLYGYVILENHLHVVAQCPDLPVVWRRFKSYTARRLVDHLKERRVNIFLRRMCSTGKSRRGGRQHQFWQEGSHPQVVEGQDMLLQKLTYIHNNPVQRGYVDMPEHWRWSSAREYAGQKAPVPVYTAW